MRTNNPFLISGYHSPEFFCDRKQETKTIIETHYQYYIAGNTREEPTVRNTRLFIDAISVIWNACKDG